MRLPNKLLRLLVALFTTLALASAQAQNIGPGISSSSGGGTAGAGLTLTGGVFTLGDGLGITYTSPGQLGLIGGIVTANAPLLAMTETWNNAAITFNGVTLNVTSTASAAASLLFSLQLNSVNQFSVRKDGFILVPGTGLGVNSLFTTGGGLVITLASTGAVIAGNGSVTGAFIAAGTKPTSTFAGGTCAGGTLVGGATAGTATLTGACAATNTWTLSVMPTATNGYVCEAHDRTTPATLIAETSTSTTTAVFTFQGTTGATDVIQYGPCIGY